jgi:hypothetical protein
MTGEHPFEKVLKAEHKAINARRAAQTSPRPEITPPLPTPLPRNLEEGGAAGDPQPPMTHTTGVCLSGGGIRSAAFCMGALQALDAVELRAPAGGTRTAFDCIDYLSTVSGGGYIGVSVSAAMANNEIDIPFIGRIPLRGAQALKGKFPFSGIVDNGAVGHLRDYSNYLLPRGSSSFLDAAVVVLRGLAANVVILTGWMFFFALVSALIYPSRDSLEAGPLARLFGPGVLFWGRFTLTLVPLVVLGLSLAVWALVRSRDGAHGRDVRGPGIVWSRSVLILLGVVFGIDLYPLIIAGVFNLATWVAGTSWSDVNRQLAAMATGVATVIAFFHDKIAQLLKATDEDDGLGTLVKRIAAFAAIWFAATILPLMLFFVFVMVTISAMQGGYQFSLLMLDGGGIWQPAFLGFGVPVLLVYFVIAALCLACTFAFAPNANSLHQLYRDKLSKAFLFDPDEDDRQPRDSGPDEGDLAPRDGMGLSEISGPNAGPYHLINAAINLQSSVHANRRGRDAGFFLFSPKFVGSDPTGFVETEELVKIDPHINLGTAMAISGAAVSANMGRYSIPVLAPTLALLNIRLGYWMRNPKYLLDGAKTKRQEVVGLTKLYLLQEMTGQLDETSPLIYLTDGGHVENLGLYQLLKRRCRVIVVVDAEADQRMAFESLSRCERYARIDMGIRIDLPWRDIAKVASDYDKVIAAGGAPVEKQGPHCALGTIEYPGSDRGILLYVKASMTGDEADYIQDYKRREHTFPHESTGDQFFTEEQFEVYRALGFHALFGALTGTHQFAYTDWGPWSPSPTSARSDQKVVLAFLKNWLAG